jgi:hypothetical protein
LSISTAPQRNNNNDKQNNNAYHWKFGDVM